MDRIPGFAVAGVELSIYSSYLLFFVSKRGTRRGTRRISIHPNFIQRFSTTSTGGQAPNQGPSALRVPSDSGPRSGTSFTAETATSSRTEIQTEHAPADQVIPQEDSVSQIQGNSPRNGELRKDVIRHENVKRTSQRCFRDNLSCVRFLRHF